MKTCEWGECITSDRPAVATVRVRETGGYTDSAVCGEHKKRLEQEGKTARRKKMSDKLREQDRPTVLGYELNRDTLTPVRKYV